MSDTALSWRGTDPADFSRRLFIRQGVATVGLGLSAPAFLEAIAAAQGRRTRQLVVVYLGGGNDALNTVIPYQDAAYYQRRPTIAIPPGQVLQLGSDRSGRALGLHPRLEGLRQIFNEGRLAVVQRTGYHDSSRSHFEAYDIFGNAKPGSVGGTGWLGRYLDTLPRPADSLSAWSTGGGTPRALQSVQTPGVSIPNAASFAYASPNDGAVALQERDAARLMVSNPATGRPQLTFVNGIGVSALDTLDRVADVATYQPTRLYPNSDLALALKTVAGAITYGIGSRVYWVQTGGYDTHSDQGNGDGYYAGLMSTLGDGLWAFYDDLRNQNLLNDTTLVVFSEFGRRISENGSHGTDHGAAGVMFVLGGQVRGGLFGSSAVLAAGHDTLENDSGDVRFETDFRAVYARLLDQWLGVDSVPILGGDFRSGAPVIF